MMDRAYKTHNMCKQRYMSCLREACIWYPDTHNCNISDESWHNLCNLCRLSQHGGMHIPLRALLHARGQSGAPFVQKTLTDRLKEYNQIHGVIRACIELLFACFRHLSIVRNMWRGHIIVYASIFAFATVFDLCK